MVGPGAETVDVAALKAATGGNLISVFGFDGSYFAAEVMAPGAGYWVNLAEAGRLDLNDPAVLAKPVAASSGEPALAGAMLWVESQGRRQELRLGVDPEAIEALPPVPPAGSFDARFVVDGVGAWQVPRREASVDYDLRVQGDFPLLGWEIPPDQAGLWELVVDGASRELRDAGSLSLEPAAEVIVRQSRGPVLPQALALEQNYPNPFNPGTTIRWDLAEAGHVSLSVYDVTGRRVRRLAQGWHAAGRYVSRWDGRDRDGVELGSGVYFVELLFRDFRKVRRMALMR